MQNSRGLCQNPDCKEEIEEGARLCETCAFNLQMLDYVRKMEAETEKEEEEEEEVRIEEVENEEEERPYPNGFCLICKKECDAGPWSLCYDPSWEHNVWGGDTHEIVRKICVDCAERELEQ